MGFAATDVKHLFPTPLVVSSFAPDVAADLNRQLLAIITERMAVSAGVSISNVGGWQSDTGVLEWGGAPIQTIIAALRELIKKVTLRVEGSQVERVDIDWKIHGWANVNRNGNYNKFHTHPGAYWSAVYYVQVDDTPGLGGELELVDPRGVTPLLYCPLLQFGLQGYTNAGLSELHKPAAGQCLLFPSWLSHGVRAYTGDKTRISIAFNFSI